MYGKTDHTYLIRVIHCSAAIKCHNRATKLELELISQLANRSQESKQTGNYFNQLKIIKEVVIRSYVNLL